MNDRMRKALTAIAGIACAASIAFAGIAFWAARSDNYQMVAMSTGSMSPMINPGDLVLVHKVAPEEIHMGDVISFNSPLDARMIVTHRVVAITQTSSGIQIKTKGDRNPAADPWQFQYAGNGWRVATVVHGAARAMGRLHAGLPRTAGALALFMLGLVLFAPSLCEEQAVA